MYYQSNVMVHEQQVIWGRTGVMVNAPVSGGLLLDNELEISGFESQVRRLSISKNFASAPGRMK